MLRTPVPATAPFAAGRPKANEPLGAGDPRSGGAWGLHLLMLWIKALHIVFHAPAGSPALFDLPSHFCDLGDGARRLDAERARLLLMARKLLRFTTLLAVPALGLGAVSVVGLRRWYRTRRSGSDARQAHAGLAGHRLSPWVLRDAAQVGKPVSASAAMCFIAGSMRFRCSCSRPSSSLWW